MSIDYEQQALLSILYMCSVDKKGWNVGDMRYHGHSSLKDRATRQKKFDDILDKLLSSMICGKHSLAYPVKNPNRLSTLRLTEAGMGYWAKHRHLLLDDFKPDMHPYKTFRKINRDVERWEEKKKRELAAKLS